MPFDGSTYNPRLDRVRLSKQLTAIRSLMMDGQWRTLAQISRATSAPEASASARLRDLRKPKFGGWTVDRRRIGIGLHEYRMSSSEGSKRVPQQLPFAY